MERITTFLSLIGCIQAIWVPPQPKTNVWVTLANLTGQDFICLSIASPGNPFQHVLSESWRIPGPTLSSPSICAPVSTPVSTTGTGGVLIYPNYHRSRKNLDSWVQLKWTAVCILIIQGATERRHKISTCLCPYIEIIQPGATILARIFPNLATRLWRFPQGSFLSVAIAHGEEYHLI